MNLELVKLPEHIVLIDYDGKIYKGDYFLLGKKFINKYMGKKEERYSTPISVKIIGYLPLKDTYKLKGVPLLPEIPNQEDLNTVAFEAIKGFTPITGHPMEARMLSDMFKVGYEAGSKNQNAEYWLAKYLNQTTGHTIEKTLPEAKKWLAENGYKSSTFPTEFEPQFIIPNSSDQLCEKDWDEYWDLFENSEDYDDYDDILDWSRSKGKKQLKKYSKMKVVDGVLQGTYKF